MAVIPQPRSPDRRAIAWAFVVAGGVAITAGVALVSVPLALIVGGLGIVAVGLLGIEVRG